MFTRRPMPSALVVLAIVGMPLLPPQHLHRAGIEGRAEALVHAHLPDASDAASGSCETTLISGHGDHRRAVFLNGDFTTPDTAAYAVSPGLVVSITSPALDQEDVLPASDASPIHGPPRLASITRGPPSIS
jgi:hypothetical protein